MTILQVQYLAVSDLKPNPRNATHANPFRLSSGKAREHPLQSPVGS